MSALEPCAWTTSAPVEAASARILAPTPRSICPSHTIRCESIPCARAVSCSCTLGFAELENTPRTLECPVSFSVRDRFRMTASAPYIPPLLMMCRTLTPHPPPAPRLAPAPRCDSPATIAVRTAHPPAHSSPVPSPCTAVPILPAQCSVDRVRRQSTPDSSHQPHSAAPPEIHPGSSPPAERT